MSLYVEAVKRGMPEGCSDEEASDWWYERDLNQLVINSRLYMENETLRKCLQKFVDGQFESPAEEELVRDRARNILKCMAKRKKEASDG